MSNWFAMSPFQTEIFCSSYVFNLCISEGMQKEQDAILYIVLYQFKLIMGGGGGGV